MWSVQFQIVPCSTLYFFSKSIGPFHVASANYRVLRSVAPVTCRAIPSSLFILASSACKSLHCLTLALTQGVKVVIYLGSLIHLCCREGGTLKKNITGMCGECLECLGHTGFAPTHSMCAFPVYTAYAPGCSPGELSMVGPGLHALPRSTSLRFRFSGTPQRYRLSWA